MASNKEYIMGTDRVAVMKMIVPICPVTGGRPLTCTQACFDRDCKRYKNGGNGKTGAFAGKPQKGETVCDSCPGIPSEVTIITEEEHNQLAKQIMDRMTKKESNVANKLKDKKCELCNEREATCRHSDKDVCATCQKIFTEVNSRNELVMKAQAIIHGASDQNKEVARALSETGKELTKVKRNLDMATEDARNKHLIIRKTYKILGGDPLEEPLDVVAERCMAIIDELTEQVSLPPADVTPALLLEMIQIVMDYGGNDRQAWLKAIFSRAVDLASCHDNEIAA